MSNQQSNQTPAKKDKNYYQTITVVKKSLMNAVKDLNSKHVDGCIKLLREALQTLEPYCSVRIG
jgi:hypothetical protein